MASFYGYIRVSTDEQVQSGLSLASQTDQLRDCYRRRYQPSGYKFGGVFEEGGVSARRLFLDRPLAAKLHRGLDRGDVICVTRIDRGFRNLRDFLEMYDLWKILGVSVYVADMNLDTSTSAGRIMALTLGLFGEVERELIAARTREAFAAKRKAGLPPSGRPVYGFVWRGQRGRKDLVPDPRQRQIGGLIVELHGHGLTWREVAAELERQGLRLDKRYRVDHTRAMRVYGMELALRAREAAALAETPVPLVPAPDEPPDPA